MFYIEGADDYSTVNLTNRWSKYLEKNGERWCQNGDASAWQKFLYLTWEAVGCCSDFDKNDRWEPCCRICQMFQRWQITADGTNRWFQCLLLPVISALQSPVFPRLRFYELNTGLYVICYKLVTDVVKKGQLSKKKSKGPTANNMGQQRPEPI